MPAGAAAKKNKGKHHAPSPAPFVSLPLLYLQSCACAAFAIQIFTFTMTGSAQQFAPLHAAGSSSTAACTWTIHLTCRALLQEYSPAAEVLVQQAKAPGADGGSYINAAKHVAPAPQVLQPHAATCLPIIDYQWVMSIKACSCGLMGALQHAVSNDALSLLPICSQACRSCATGAAAKATATGIDPTVAMACAGGHYH